MSENPNPSHIAIIMDGNGRWAKKRGLPRLAGHKAGMEALKKIVRYCGDNGIENLTVYAFSTENWKRSDEEVGGIFKILVLYLERELAELCERGVRLRILGDYSIIPSDAKTAVDNAIEQTKDNKGLSFNIALNYGGRDDILRAAKKLAQDVKDGFIDISDLNEEEISSRLYTSDLPDPELIIRTSGEIRLSNFLLWQSAYSEFYFTDELWPDFDEESIKAAINDYKLRKRNFGGR